MDFLPEVAEMIESRVCPDCSEPVPPGRLSCPACGALLAAVAGVPFRVPTMVRTTGEPIAAGEASGPNPPAAPAAPAAPAPAAAAAATSAAAAPAAQPPTPPAAVPDPTPPAVVSEPPPLPAAAVPPRLAAAGVVGGSRPFAQGMPLPGGPPPRPSGPPTPARGTMVPAWQSGPESAADDKPVAAPRPSAVDLPFSLPPGFGPRLVTLGAAVATLAFLLPWADGPTGVVIGGDIGPGYFARWGLAAIGNVVPLVATVATLLLALVPGRLPSWLTLGALPLAVGAALAGTAWTYLVSKYSVGLGIDLLMAAAAVLAAGGLLGIRHAAGRSSVD